MKYYGYCLIISVFIILYCSMLFTIRITVEKLFQKHLEKYKVEEHPYERSATFTH